MAFRYAGDAPGATGFLYFDGEIDDPVSTASGDVAADSGSVGGSASGGNPSGASGDVTADSGSVGGGASGLLPTVRYIDQARIVTSGRFPRGYS